MLTQLMLVLALLGATVSGQDYQDYQENTPRAAPIRLRASAALPEAPRPTPVPILKQINKHNEDGSYTYGYEGADGSFKIETKLATGEVKGKYGYVDETGKVRVVEYGANKYGFQPSGEGITVAPPTLVDETAKDGIDYEDEPPRPLKQYRVQRPKQQARPAPRPQPQPQPQYVQYEEEEEVEQQQQQQPEPPRRLQYVPQSLGPAQPRLQIPGAQRSTDVLYSPQQRPARPEPDYSQSQSFGDGPSNVRISRPIYAPAPANPAPSSARAQGFLTPASGGPPILDSLQFGGGPTPLARPVQPAAASRYQPQPQQQHQQQQQQQQQQPQPQYQSQGQSLGRSGGGSLLDQLARDYALPQGNAQPLHDISFGYY